MRGVYRAAEERGRRSPVKAVLVASALVTAADHENSPADAHIMQPVPTQEF